MSDPSNADPAPANILTTLQDLMQAPLSEDAKNVTTPIQQFLDDKGVDFNINDNLVSNRNETTIATLMALTVPTTVPEGATEKATALVETVKYFHDLTDEQHKIMMAKLMSSGMEKEYKLVKSLRFAVKFWKVTGVIDL